ncbi:DNA/RNA non-specific endonuclease [Pseudophaeobacter sp.]|uniref:DNA/RNA non-specific endonuclease n=1 Tax=Pseudophaeobacter sp. TaxID=1971739 RepID=UPI003297FE4D
MNDPFQMQPELRYGAPVCDQILTNRFFSIGYSWHHRQAKWTLEIISQESMMVHDLPEVERKDYFRADLRVPRRFRAGLGAYEGSGFDRGHLVASADKDLLHIQNSETFLLSNMSPQVPSFNRGVWKRLEKAVRTLDQDPDIFETYVLTAPVFYFGKIIETIGDDSDASGIDIPIPHAFVKSVLTENKRGQLSLWTFKLDNQALDGDLEDYLVVTYDAEQLIGGRFWDRVAGGDLHDQKKSKGRFWS